MVWLLKSELGPPRVRQLREGLTVEPKSFGAGYGGEHEQLVPIRCYVETDVEIGVPRAWWFARAKQDHDYVWDGVSTGAAVGSYGSEIRFESPYEEQGAVVDAYVERFRPVLEGTDRIGDTEFGLRMGALFQAMTGFGKTQCALAIAHRLRVATLICVHKEFLATQWRRRIERYLPGARVGVCQGPECDYEDKDFVIGMVQSLSIEDASRYPGAFYTWPGLVIQDEVHRAGAPSVSRVPPLFPAALRLGLTATPRRKDGCEPVFWWHFGEVLRRGLTETPKPGVRRLHVVSENVPAVALRERVSPAVVTNVIVKLKRRNQVVVAEVMRAVTSANKRKVMVLSDRLEHLRVLEAAVVARAAAASVEVSTSFYVGEWFTGEAKPPLEPGKWPKTDDGFKAAVKVIYQSMARRRANAPVCFVRDDKHWVTMTGFDLNAIHGLYGQSAYPDDSLVEVPLEDQPWDRLFDIARAFKVRQKGSEKKRTLTEEDLIQAEKAQVIFCTVQMVAEGVDIPAVDTLVMATPIGDAEQAVGRIRRFCVPKSFGGTQVPKVCEHLCAWRHTTCSGKPVPVVVDVVDANIPLGAKRARSRDRFYKANEIKVAQVKA